MCTICEEEPEQEARTKIRKAQPGGFERGLFEYGKLDVGHEQKWDEEEDGKCAGARSLKSI